ncbi:MAG: hypothetical protein WD205_02670 [Rhodothermales bacterium]
MRTAVVACILLVISATSLHEAQAQVDPNGDERTEQRGEISVGEAARMMLRPAFRARAVSVDTLTEIRSRPVEKGRVDVESGVYRSRYRIRERVPGGLTPEAGAREHLRRSAEAYGLPDEIRSLSVESLRGGRYAHHVRLRQALEGVPVYGRDVTVSLDNSGQPTMVVNGYASHLDLVETFDPVPRLSQAQARRIVQTAASRELDAAEPELVVYPSKPPRLVWKVSASMDELPVSWDVLIDARTGEVVRMIDVSTHARERVDLSSVPVWQAKGQGSISVAPRSAFSSGVSAAAPAALSSAFSSAGSAPSSSPSQFGVGASTTLTGRTYSAPAAVDGTGFVFDPDPLTSAGVTYGGAYVDNDDADSPALNEQRFTVTLREITDGGDGTYRLEGPYVRIEGDPEDVPVESSPHSFTYTRADDRFEAVNAYYHVDKSQRYVQSLDVGFPIKNEPVRVNPRAFTQDDSNYNPGQDLIRFGTGGIDDGEDADVIWHEYAHVLLNFTTPGLTGRKEGNALHEGWSDYWAASYSRYLSEDDPQIPEHNWRRLYTWDGNVPCWPGRTLDHDGHYPDDQSYDPPGCQVIIDFYQWGLLWATTLMDIYPQVGRGVLDRLNLASHAYLSSTATLADAAEALIQADYDLYGGIHSSVLVQELGEAGYVDPTSFGPILEHEPLAASEDLGGAANVVVAATATTAPVDSVTLHYAIGDGPFVDVGLARADGDRYEGELSFPDEPETIRYYVEAVDVDGRRRRLPPAAPTETYAFDVGPDTEPPTIVHDAPLKASVIAWPIDLFAEVDDNLGVDTVWVEYVRHDPGGSVAAEAAFGMEESEGVYRGRFPTPASAVLEGESFSYRIFARDASMAGNETAYPAEGQAVIEIVTDGVLRAFDFEGINEGLTATGVWASGKPAFGLRVARSGAVVWATRPAAAYPETAGLSSLQLPGVDLEGLGSTYLVFWQWHDFEHNGLAQPGTFDDLAGIWDGGNVKVSVDGGATWEVVEPEGGYNGTIGTDFENPLGGEPGFGGYSYGWRREIVELPSAADVRVRFDFGTDGSNAEEALFYAGWYVDDVVITTELPEDAQPPSASGLPAARTIRLPDRADPPSISITAQDDTGIEAVISRYEVYSGDGSVSGSRRLAMSGTRLDIFEGFVVPEQSFEAGDRIEYTLLLRDFDGNETEYGNPFVVDFRSEQRTSVLQGAVATGIWRPLSDQWIAEGTSSETGSSIILQPFTVSSNGERNELVLEHIFSLGDAVGGNVKISDDDGATWSVLEPDEAYPAVFSPDNGHRMAGQPVFAGTSDGIAVHVFDLDPYAGRTVRVRVDLAHPQTLDPSETWILTGLTYQARTAETKLAVERTLTLHANFPDPVSDATTVSYTVPGDETMPVRLSVYDVLGRRVALIRHAQHEPGTYTVQYDARGLASGLYVLFLETPVGTRSERMMVVR